MYNAALRAFRVKWGNSLATQHKTQHLQHLQGATTKQDKRVR